MESKFKVGDKVLLTKPKDTKTDGLIWFPKMDKFDGKCFYVENINTITGRYYCRYDKTFLWLHKSWLTKLEENPSEEVTKQVAEQVTEQEPQQCCEKRGIEPVDLTKKQVDLIKKEDLSNIDWEYRRWDLASKLFSLTSHEQAISSADSFIEQYKQKLN